MQLADYYGILGVEADADQRAIRSAYRRLARRHHPDVATDDHAGTSFLLIREAYEVLSQPERRRHYDRTVAEQALRRRSPESQAASAPSGTGPAVEPPLPRRGLRVVVDALGIRIDAGVGLGKPWRGGPAGAGRRRKSQRP
jgi:DnaJ-class molecular chaperone